MHSALAIAAWWSVAVGTALFAVWGIRRAHGVTIAGRVAALQERSGRRRLRRWQLLCARAAVDERAWLRASLVWGAGVAFTLVWVGVVYAAIGLVFVVGARIVRLYQRARAQRQRIEFGIPAFLESVAAELRVGATVPGAVLACAPRNRALEGSLGVVERAVALGEPFPVALRRWSLSVPQPGVVAATAALSLAFTLGGHLAPVLEQLAQTLRDRSAVRAELRAQTTQVRLSAWVVGAAPLVALAIYGLLYPQALRTLLATSSGQLALGVALISECTGIWCIARILQSNR